MADDVVRPGYPFSVKTFELLVQLKDSPLTKNFYSAHEEKFKPMENPFKQLSNQAVEKLPAQIKEQMAQEPMSFGQSIRNTLVYYNTQVYSASERDFCGVFGWEDDSHRRNFAIGKPLGMEVPVCIDLERFIERNNGIFGDSGTGKSFLIRLLLSGIIRKQAAVNLIFDLRSEYGWEAVCQGKESSTVKGLQQLFPGQVQVYTLDPEFTRLRGVRDAQELYLGYDEIEVEDIMLVQTELSIEDASLKQAIILRNQLGRSWITEVAEKART